MQLSLHANFHHHHHLGRFLAVRRSYSFLCGQFQALRTEFRHEWLDDQSSLFAPIEIADCVRQMQQQGVYCGITLPPAIVDQVYQFAQQNPCTEPGFATPFRIDQVPEIRSRTGHQILRGLVSNLSECGAIDQIIHDPQLLQVVQRYLGYRPTQIDRHLTWSLPSDLSEAEQKRRYPPANYHYDVAGLNFMAINFYITDVDATSGPHVMMLNSHKRKKLGMVFASARQSDAVVEQYYGKSNEITIVGDRGSGFIQDSSCYHKVVPPQSRDRLFLQIRYS